MSTLIISFLSHLVIIGACVFLLLCHVTHPSIVVFAGAALLRCIALVPMMFVGRGTRSSIPVIGIANAANITSLVLFALGFIMLAIWLARRRF